MKTKINFVRLILSDHANRMYHKKVRVRRLLGRLTGKGHLGRSTRIWEDSIIKDLKEIDVNIRNWIDSVENTDYRMVLQVRHRTSGFHKSCS